jgi:periplasmic protein TonB
MTTRDGRFLPSLAIALAVHALLLLFLSRALAHQVFEAPVVTLEVQVASAAPAPARQKPAAPAPLPVPPPSRAVPSADAPRPEVSRPTAPTPSPTPPRDQAASPPAAASMSDAPPAPAANAAPAPAVPASVTSAASAGSAAAADAGQASVGTGVPAAAPPGASTSDGETVPGGSGFESADTGSGTGSATFKADIDPVLVRTIQVPYPAAARRLGKEGTVRVLVEVGTDGAVISDEIYSSSGNRMLDSAALDAVKKARFLPALKNGRPVIARILVPIRFRLTD